MNHSKWVRASAVMAAGFAAGVLAVIATDAILFKRCARWE